MDVIPPHDPFDAPDADDEADTRERVLEGGEDAGDGDAPRVREELGVDDVPGASSTPRSPDDPGRLGASTSPAWGGADATQPGADVHAWEISWASVEEDAAEDPDAALSQYADIVEEMLVASGYVVEDPVARGGEEREIVVTYQAARDTAERGDVSRSEVEQAIEDLRAVFESLLSDARSA